MISHANRKIVCRYRQYEGANRLVARVVASKDQEGRRYQLDRRARDAELFEKAYGYVRQYY